MKILFFSFFILFSNLFFDIEETKTEGIVTYTYQGYGAKKPFEKHLRFNENRAWFSHQQEKETIIDDRGYNYYYYNEKQEWYYQNDSVYYFNESDHYPNYFSRWAAKEIEWEITGETQTIAGFVATKAIAKSFNDKSPYNSESTPYRGKAIVWFTTEIPLSYGIDGYEGLPGLIVKLQYENYDNIYITTLKSIEYKEVEDWELPSTDKKIELDRSDAYNPWKLSKKWFKKKAKEMRIK